MKRHSVILLLLTVLFSIVIGCKGVPKDVISVNDMASLMADMHTAEVVASTGYHTDSSKQALKQSVLMHHGVTQAQFDTSMMWYGRNMEHYIEMYDKVIKKLEKRSAAAGAQIVQSANAFGDSVDLWAGSRYLIVDDRLPSRLLSFDLLADSATIERGDTYTWRIKLIGIESGSVRWNILANYADSTVEYVNMQTTNNASLRKGWNEITFFTDSAKNLQRMRGTLEITVDDNPVIWIDSISLVRKRFNDERYRERTRQRRYSEYQ